MKYLLLLTMLASIVVADCYERTIYNIDGTIITVFICDEE